MKCPQCGVPFEPTHGRQKFCSRECNQAACHPPEWGPWHEMIRRCCYPKPKDAELYEGVKVCARWRRFRNFLADMGPRPGPEYSIDRYPDRRGEYEPSNCRWATPKQQATDRRKPRLST